jgi:hypothetical protein
VSEYDCVDCGVHVYEFGREEPPAPPRCAVCQWLAELPDQVEAEKLRAHLQRRGVLDGD